MVDSLVFFWDPLESPSPRPRRQGPSPHAVVCPRPSQPGQRRLPISSPADAAYEPYLPSHGDDTQEQPRVA
jgi:hypothetical protein